jgi:GH25 family lysozyme M1 (1,4-beta-N-acetylmuramidase)
VQFWMHEEDRKLVRELSAWLAGQGVRPSDSMVIRAALRLAKTGSGLIEAYWKSAKLDGRIKRD